MGDVRSLVEKVLGSQAKLGGLLVGILAVLAGSGQADCDFRPAAGAWSFTEVAAHMCQVEIACIWGRMLTEDKPYFGRFYLNSGRDFSDIMLIDSVHDWYKWRRRVVDLVGRLSAEQFARQATHVHFGEITVLDILGLTQTTVENGS